MTLLADCVVQARKTAQKCPMRDVILMEVGRVIHKASWLAVVSSEKARAEAAEDPQYFATFNFAPRDSTLSTCDTLVR